ncbi:MAG TPA: hypothetical protein VH092_18030 [Urbifossiella sp.]|jgi:hypothetical protein|nr:hypothetical protein [Urbifossiella sp.]
MSITTDRSQTIQTLADLSLSSAYSGAITALDRLDKAVTQVSVGAGSEEARKGAEAMRGFILVSIRKLAAELRSGGAPVCQGWQEEAG